MAKILFITPMWYEEITPRAAKVCNFFVEDWVKQGHEVVVVHYRSQFPDIYHKVAKLFPSLYKKICGDNTRLQINYREIEYAIDGGYVMSIPVKKYIPHGKLSNRTYNRLAQYLQSKLNAKKFTPDVIVGHFCNPALGIICCLRHHFTNVKTGIVLHEKSATINRIYGNKAETLLNFVDSIGFRSVAIKDDVCSFFNLQNKKFMCYSGVASSFIDKAFPKRNWKSGPIKNFLYVGRLADYKYPQTIVEALLKQYQDKDFSMTYVGSLDKAYTKTKMVVDNNGINEQVRFLGQIKREDIINWYDASDCFVMISDNEVFGLVYLEAMSRGCITVAGDNGGMVGIIEHGVNGYLCKPGDSKALSSIIETINKMSSEEKSAMSIKARETAIAFSDSNVASSYLSNLI